MNSRHTRNLEPPTAFEPLQTFRFPFRLTALLTWLLFSLLFVLATVSLKVPAFYIRSLFLWVAAVVLFSQYTFLVLEYTSRGYQEVPKLSGSMVFTSNDMRIWQVVAIGVVATALGTLVTDNLGRIAFAAVLFVMLPVAVSGVVLGGNLGLALNPLTWLNTLRGFGLNRASVTFSALQALLMTAAALLVTRFGDVDGVHLLWMVPLLLLLAITTVRALGVLLNSRAEHLGLLVNQSAESHAAAVQAHQVAGFHSFLSGLYPLMRADRAGEAWTMLLEQLQRGQWSTAPAALDHLKTWEDQRLALRLALEMIERHIGANELARAWALFDYAHRATAGDIKLLSGRTALALAYCASGKTQSQQAAHALAHFGRDFPNHPGADEALKLRLQLALVDPEIDVGDIHRDLKGRRALIADPEARDLIRRVRRMQGRAADPER